MFHPATYRNEGFQSTPTVTGDAATATATAVAATAKAAATVSKCDANSVTFPLGLALTASDTLYDSVDEPLAIDFQWATRSTPPTFINKAVDATTDEVGAGNTNLSTLRYKNVTYTVQSVQIAAATHTKWILPTSAQDSNTEDIIMIFSNTSATIQYQYIMIVIPILRTGSPGTPVSQSDPPYLLGLGNGTQSTGPYSLQSCIPSNPKSTFAYYSACLDGRTANAPPSFVNVFISVEGLPVTRSLMNTILKARGAATTFPTPTLPYIATSSGINTLVNNTEFTTYVNTSSHLLDYSNVASIFKDMSIVSRTDPTSAYTCSQLNPDTDVGPDGTLQVDLTTGMLLSDVLAERAAIKTTHSPTATNAMTAKANTVLYTILGIAGAICVIFILIYGVLQLVSPTTILTLPTWVQTIPVYGVMLLLATLLGFLIGALIR